ncbi:MAG TPA: CAP domain-containing protein [Aquihabitans sp.]|jgi:uncharacterized protein YkwD|nr:CAP domain-containing protein [Aquihabitans sp.]
MTRPPAPRLTPTTRTTAVAAVALAVSLLLGGCLSVGQRNAYDALQNDRRAHGRRTLPTQASAQRKAQAWANQLARENRLRHSTLASGINVRWCNIGENVGVGGTTTAVQRGFMGSSAHRANVLSTTWNGVGVGVARNGSRVFVVHVFIRTC